MQEKASPGVVPEIGEPWFDLEDQSFESCNPGVEEED
jgi:hypothetical protein